MGYTQVCSVGDPESPEWKIAWPQLVQDVHKIVETAEVLVSGPTDDKETVTPFLADPNRGIYINGVGSGAHDPFVLRPGQWDAFCQTAHKSYEKVVICILLRAYKLAPESFAYE
ncbi:hypothetical protein PENSTE_c001G10066 [Penicillium steckii]|uniref:Uncharacterized protein n=1 Tax=Penicillium steckii TaxID=303698 RepID=A0A1V6TYT0_9EURO|nr:hypothetical protein PENSTE_c001G10066 [Penicillium steckii]